MNRLHMKIAIGNNRVVERRAEICEHLHHFVFGNII